MARQNNDQTGIRKLTKVGGKTFAVSLPIDLVKQLRWSKGDELIVRRQSSFVIIQKKENQ
jgi:phosphate uptake regulator